MSQRQAKIAWGSLLAGLCCFCIFFSIGTAQNSKTAPVETLLPADTVLFFGWDGNAAHKQAWEQTAAYEALSETGLLDLVRKFFEGFQPQGMPPEAREMADMVSKAYEIIADNGLSASLALPSQPGPPIPSLTVVFHKASNLKDGLGKVGDAISQNSRGQVQFSTKQIQSRSVTSAVIPTDLGIPIEVGWWVEGEHLVFVVGVNAVESAVTVAAGGAPNLSTSAVWKKQSAKGDGFEQTTLGWLDFAILRERFAGMPLPPMGPDAPQRSVNDILKALGLGTLETIVCKSGYKGRSMWSETQVVAPGPKRGLLALADQKPITMDDLPPIPFGTNGFYASSLDWSKLYDDLITVVTDVAKLGPPDVAGQVDGMIGALPQMLGFDLKTDLLDPLGNIVCIYGDTRQGFFGMGTGLVLKVDDAAKLRSTIDTILARITAMTGGNLGVIRAEKHGRQILLLEFQGAFSGGGIVVDDEWMAVGLLPQTVEAFLLRLDGKLTNWSPSRSYQQGLDELPKKFTSIVAMDPRKSYRVIMGLAPLLLNAGMVGLKEARLIDRDAEAPISLADIPPAEQVSRPLFPNLTVNTIDENGFMCTSRTSLPGIPLLAGGGGGSTVATSGVLVALLLPAVQQARTAARRSQSRNNLKQIALSLHNYHETFGSLPEGTVPNDDLDPDNRLSWMSKILPFIEQAALYENIDFKKAWDDDAHDMAVRSRIQAFQNPQVAEPPVPYGTTHYVGIAGVGKDAPTLPANDKRAGAFGYNRATRFRDVRDGLSNTIGVTEASDDFGPWAAGGKPTIRALTTKPYINGPDGIGSPFPGGMNAMLLDGSVRFVSENIDPSVLEALSTISGGEVIGEF
jgi:hypothetical protein